MPSNVTRFEWLYYASLALYLVQVILTYGDQYAFAVRLGLGNPFILATNAITIAAYVLLIRLVARRRKNWARWILLFLFALSLTATGMQLGPMLRMSTTEGLLSLGTLLLQGAGMFLIFTGNAQEWFRQPEPAA